MWVNQGVNASECAFPEQCESCDNLDELIPFRIPLFERSFGLETWGRQRSYGAFALTFREALFRIRFIAYMDQMRAAYRAFLISLISTTTAEPYRDVQTDSLASASDSRDRAVLPSDSSSGCFSFFHSGYQWARGTDQHTQILSICVLILMTIYRNFTMFLELNELIKIFRNLQKFLKTDEI